MTFSNKELLLFDLDGTLINSAPDLARAVNFMLTGLGRETFTEETIDGWVGNGAQMLVKRALSGTREINKTIDEVLFEKALKSFLAYYAEHLCVSTVAYPNVSTTLKALKDKGYRMAIVTNKPFAFVEPILEGLGLEGLFELVLGGDSLEVKKPDPAPLLYACSNLEVAVENTLMIGDSKNDIQAANSCGMQSIGVTYGYNYGEKIDVHHPTVIINDFAELLELL